MSEDPAEQLISDLITTQKRLSTLLESVADDQDWQPDSVEWSFRYIAAHLATVDRDCYRDRVVRISAGENPHFESYFNSGWDFSKYDLMDSLREWATTRQEIIDFVHVLPKDKWLLTGTHAAFGMIKVHDVLKMMRDHDQEHIVDLEQMIIRYKSHTQNSQ